MALLLKLCELFLVYCLLCAGLAAGNHSSSATRVSRTRLTIPTRSSNRLSSVPVRLSGSSLTSRPSLTTGPQHDGSRRMLGSSQRLAGPRRRIILLPTGTLTHRFRQFADRRRQSQPQPSVQQASHRSVNPAQTPVIQQRPRSRPQPEIRWLTNPSSGKSIMTRNLEVIDRRIPTHTGGISSHRVPVPRQTLKTRVQVQPAKVSRTSNNVNRISQPTISEAHNSQTNVSDMVSINDLLAIIKSIRRNDSNSNASSSTRVAGVTDSPNQPTAQSNWNIGSNLHTPLVQTERIQARSKPSTGRREKARGVKGPTGTTRPDPVLDMLIHFAMMNANDVRADPLSSLISNPALLSQLARGWGRGPPASTPSPFPTGVFSTVKGRVRSPKLPTLTSSPSNSTLTTQQGMLLSTEDNRPAAQTLRNNTRSNRRPNVIRTGNPLQDKMITDLLRRTMNNVREDFQDQLRQQLSETDLPLVGAMS